MNTNVTKENDLPYLLILSEFWHSSLQKLKEFHKNYGSAENIFKNLGQIQKSNLITSKQIETLLMASKNIDVFKRKANNTLQQNIRFVLYNNDHFPSRLTQIASCPFILFYKGNMRVAEHHIQLAIVG